MTVFLWLSKLFRLLCRYSWSRVFKLADVTDHSPEHTYEFSRYFTYLMIAYSYREYSRFWGAWYHLRMLVHPNFLHLNLYLATIIHRAHEFYLCKFVSYYSKFIESNESVLFKLIECHLMWCRVNQINQTFYDKTQINCHFRSKAFKVNFIVVMESFLLSRLI